MTLTDEIRVRLTAEQKTRLEAEAERRGLGVSSWARTTLLEAASVETAAEAETSSERKPGAPAPKRAFVSRGFISRRYRIQ